LRVNHPISDKPCRGVSLKRPFVFAASRDGRLTVSVCSTPETPLQLVYLIGFNIFREPIINVQTPQTRHCASRALALQYAANRKETAYEIRPY